MLIVHDDDNVQRPNPVDDQDELLQLGRSELPLLDHLGRGERGIELGKRAVEQAELVERVPARESRVSPQREEIVAAGRHDGMLRPCSPTETFAFRLLLGPTRSS